MTFFFGGGGGGGGGGWSDDVIVSDRFRSENFLNPGYNNDQNASNDNNDRQKLNNLCRKFLPI